MKLSIRFLLLAVAVIAPSTAAITAGGMVASLFHAAVALCILFAAITAVVGINRPRAVASGFVIPSILCALLLFAFGHDEFHPHTGSLPTTSFARYGYDALYHPVDVDMQTGQIVPNYNPSAGGFGGGGGMPTVLVTSVFPDPSAFMTSFHACVLLLAGSMGGMYADWLHRKQTCNANDG